MTTLMDRINLANAAYRIAVPEGIRFDIAENNPKVKAANCKCLALEAELAERFEEILSQYQDGFITASELLLKMMNAAYKEEKGTAEDYLNTVIRKKLDQNDGKYLSIDEIVIGLVPFRKNPSNEVEAFKGKLNLIIQQYANGMYSQTEAVVRIIESIME